VRLPFYEDMKKHNSDSKTQGPNGHGPTPAPHEIARENLSLTAQQKLDLAIKQEKAKLGAQFYEAVNARVQEFLNYGESFLMGSEIARISAPSAFRPVWAGAMTHH
jgi:hypothetical protein